MEKKLEKKLFDIEELRREWDTQLNALRADGGMMVRCEKPRNPKMKRKHNGNNAVSGVRPKSKTK